MKFPAAFVTFAPLFALAILGAAFWHQPWSSTRILGLAATIVGFVFLTISRLQLGNSFSVTPQAKQLVTTGIYSRIRNPIYLFSSLAIAGLALYMDRPWLLLVLLLVIPMQIARARAEARVLQKHFGEAYAQYRKNTWF